MAEHAPQVRKPAQPAASAKAQAAGLPGGYRELLDRRSGAALAGYVESLAGRAEAMAGPVRPAQLKPDLTGPPSGAAVIQRAVRARWLPADRTDAPESVVQAVSYRRTGGTEAETVDVDTGADQVTLSGHVLVEDNLVPVTGSVPLRADEVTQNQVQADGNPATRIQALRVRNISASPTGMRLGNLLTLYHGLAAEGRGIPYVVARDIVGAAESFYTRLGFTWLLDPGPRPALQAERREIQVRMQAIANAETRRGRPLPPQLDGRSAMDAAGDELMAVDERIGRAGMFVPTATLIESSRAAIAGYWVAE